MSAPAATPAAAATAAPTTHVPINIIIPMGGIGSRFQKDQFRFPKPLVNIVGHPMLFWLMDNLDIRKEDTVFIAIMDHIDAQFALGLRIKKQYPKLNIKIVLLNFETRGAAETLFITLQHMSQEELRRRTISLDCDTFYFCDILKWFRELPANTHASYYFEDTAGKPVFSYLKLAEDGRILEVKEKSAISTHANTGAYGFASAEALRKYCGRLLDESVGAVGEYYTSSVIQAMLADGERFQGIHVPKFVCVGTPWQLNEFLRQIREGSFTGGKKMRFCFDLDNTLVSYPLVDGDYTTCQPIERNIQLVRELKAAGHYIIIWTARRMKTHKGNVGAVLADIGLITFNSLHAFKVPYDEINFGKPQADIYVDDLAVNAMIDTDKEIGWSLSEPASTAVRRKQIRNFVSPRQFNTIIETDEMVTKTGPKSSISGEVYFYRHIPQDIASLFPRVVSIDDGAELESNCIKMERIKGITFSHLSANRCITEGRFRKFLAALQRIHASAGVEGDRDGTANGQSVNFYANYAAKVKQRFNHYRGIYNSLDSADEVERMHTAIQKGLAEYEEKKLAVPHPVIHGNPVFSNVLLTSSGNIVFIDMRGSLGPVCTVQGDVFQDLCKVYQSLCGYDFIILDRAPLTPDDVQHLESLKQIFLEHVKTHYPKVALSYLNIFTASLFFSLIPLHEGLEHQQLFIKAARKLIEF